MNFQTPAVLMAILAAALYGISTPVSKLLLVQIPPALMASLLYLGAGAGMLLLNTVKAISRKKSAEACLTKEETPYIVGMILLDIAAPFCLMLGLNTAKPANVSLLSNFEIVATALVALLIFREAVGRRMWIAIGLITASSIILSVEDFSSFSFSAGSVFVILACICWGFENNCTRMMSLKDPLQIVVIKGFGSGTGSMIIAIMLKQYATSLQYVLAALLLGFVAYGLSIYFYIRAQRELGAARTSAWYAVAPFIGVMVSIMIFGQEMTPSFVSAVAIMVFGAYFAAVEHHAHSHVHEELTHEHRHNHLDPQHNHQHETDFEHDHCHAHTHERTEHSHRHTPDMHHSHVH